MQRIYFDTNQLYFIRRIAHEADGYDYGDYQWAYCWFPKRQDLVEDVRALCYIVALQYEWDLDFLPSSASFAELGLSRSRRAQATREACLVFAEGLQEGRALQKRPFETTCRVSGRLSLTFIKDPADRVIIRDSVAEDADVLLTCDSHILTAKERLAELGIIVMRPREWLNMFLGLRGDENAVDWLERVLFGMNKRAGGPAF